MSTFTLTVDLATSGTTILFMIISFILGVVGTIACYALGFIHDAGRGFLEALGGSRPSSRPEPKPSKLLIFFRAVLYFAGGIAALVLAANGMAIWSYLLGIFTALCFGVILVKLFK